MFRQNVNRVTSTVISTGRFAAAIPMGVVHSVLERIGRGPSGTDSSQSGQPSQATTPSQARHASPAKQATEAAERKAAATDGGDAAKQQTATESTATKAPAKRTAKKAAKKTQGKAKPAAKKTQGKAAPAATEVSAAEASTPGEAHREDEPEVVLAVDLPPEQMEEPVDVVGEALAAEAEEPPAPAGDAAEADHVEDDHPVVYSTDSKDS